MFTAGILDAFNNASSALVLGGLILLVLAILGGGIEVREIRIPRLSAVSRAIAGLVGVILIGLGATSAARNPLATEQTFHNPLYRGKRLDLCYVFANACGFEAANKWCRDKGYSSAVDFEIDSKVGSLGVPTIIMGTDQTCDQAYCSAFRSITCKK